MRIDSFEIPLLVLILLVVIFITILGVCLKTHTPQEVIDCYIRMCGRKESDWKPLYKPDSIDKIYELNNEKD